MVIRVVLLLANGFVRPRRLGGCHRRGVASSMAIKTTVCEANLRCEPQYRFVRSCASGVRYTGAVDDLRDELSAATRRYRRTESAHEEARQALIAAVLAALRGGVPPTEVERLSPFTAAYIRRTARAEGIPPASPGPKRVSS